MLGSLLLGHVAGAERITTGTGARLHNRCSRFGLHSARSGAPTRYWALTGPPPRLRVLLNGTSCTPARRRTLTSPPRGAFESTASCTSCHTPRWSRVESLDDLFGPAWCATGCGYLKLDDSSRYRSPTSSSEALLPRRLGGKKLSSTPCDPHRGEFEWSKLIFCRCCAEPGP